MGIWDKFGRNPESNRPAQTYTPDDADAQAIARYRYMLKTAPPETIEQAHAEAFAALTPEQRRKVLESLRDTAPERERAAVMGAGDSPGELARLATRSEIRQPGTIERALGGPGGPGLGSMVAGSLLGSMAGTVLGSLVAQHFFSSHPAASELFSHDAPHDAPGVADNLDQPDDPFGDDVLNDVGVGDLNAGDNWV